MMLTPHSENTQCSNSKMRPALPLHQKIVQKVLFGWLRGMKSVLVEDFHSCHRQKRLDYFNSLYVLHSVA